MALQRQKWVGVQKEIVLPTLTQFVSNDCFWLQQLDLEINNNIPFQLLFAV